MPPDKPENKLSLETSPYLLQHAENPVHWLPWNEESLALAKSSNRPILLSIGYSACHWCHVMAHESFEDHATAVLMNDHFINIKVDKEERPDLDKVYQNAHSLLTERPGGWPLTIFLTPDRQLPIFAGTYFPPDESHGLPSFKDLLNQIVSIWRERQADIDAQTASLETVFQQIYDSTRPIEHKLDSSVIDIARNQVENQFDATNGGYSSPPKFPHPAIIDFSIRHWVHTHKTDQADTEILHAAVFTLEKMAEGGIFDHLGGGFCRYSTDDSWMIPHFEKMLYDNGPLLSLYSQAWRLTSNPIFLDAANETARWVMREMQSTEGGYYSSQDADSEGIEGKFYVWSQNEIDEHFRETAKNDDFSPNSFTLFKQRFGLNLNANFEGFWHLHGYETTEKLASENKLEAAELNDQFKLLRQSLYTERSNRTPPETDRKTLCSWNGLMIHGMSHAGRLLGKPEYVQSAIDAAYFLKNNCWKDGRLLSSIKDGKTGQNAFADDYAFLIYGLLDLLQSKWDSELYEWALQLADTLLKHHEDKEYGGFFYTSHDHEELVQRLKVFNDDAIPSGNAIASLALTRLGFLAGDNSYVRAAERSLQSAWKQIEHHPLSHCAMLNALREFLSPPDILILRTIGDDTDLWQSEAQRYNLNDTLIYNIPADTVVHSSLSDKITADTSIAYPCCGKTCQPTINSLADLHKYLRNNSYRDLE